MKPHHTAEQWLMFFDGKFQGITGNKEDVEKFNDKMTAGNVSFIYVPISQALAAPELLGALEHTANYMRSLYGGHDGANEVDIYRIVVSTIAKAKGE